MSRVDSSLFGTLVFLSLVLSSAPSASAQSFGLDSDSDVEHLWFDGEDLLVTSGAEGLELRHRSGATHRLAAPHVAIGGRGEGRNVQLVVLGRNMVGRLRGRLWETFPAEVPGHPRAIVIADDGQAMGWNTFGSFLVHVGGDSLTTQVSLPPDTKPIAVFASGFGFDVFVDGPDTLLMRYENGTLRRHERDAQLQAAGGCPAPSGAVQMPDASFVVYGRSHLCHFDSEGTRTLTTRGRLFGDDVHTIVRVAQVGEQLFVYDSGENLTRWRPGQPEGTLVAENLRTTLPRFMWVDPASDQVVFGGTEFHLFHVPTGHAPRPPHSSGAWLTEVQDRSEVLESDASTGGFSSALPILRLGFGGLTSLGGGDGGAFAFDFVSGARFLFRTGDRHPMLGVEFGYSRRGGDFRTHDLTLGLTGGYTSNGFGMVLAESLLVAVGPGRSGVGIRSALRLSVLTDLIGFEVAHGHEFEAKRHELRIQLLIDVGQLIFIAATVNRMMR